LPPKINLTDFNKAIKRIAQCCEIEQLIESKLFDSKKKRKEKGIYKKAALLLTTQLTNIYLVFTFSYTSLPLPVLLFWAHRVNMLQPGWVHSAWAHRQM